VPVIAAGVWCWYPDGTPAHRAAVAAYFKTMAAETRWDTTPGDSPPAVRLADGESYWVIRRDDVNDAHNDAAGNPVPVHCVHLFAAPAVADARVFLKPRPYSLFGFGWLSWPERGTDCKPETLRSAGK